MSTDGQSYDELSDNSESGEYKPPSWIHLESATAEEIVEKLRIYWDADDLTVGHCTSTPASSVIFDYLCSEEGQQIPLRLISFKNGIDDLSLEALASYLTSRRTWFGLTHLDILIVNEYAAEQIVSFAQAIDKCRLPQLTLRGSSDFFVQTFLPHLKNNFHLDLVGCALTSASKQVILDYIATRRGSSMAEVVFLGSHIGFPNVQQVVAAPRKVQDIEILPTSYWDHDQYWRSAYHGIVSTVRKMMPVFRTLLLHQSSSNLLQAKEQPDKITSKAFAWHRLPLELGIAILWWAHEPGDFLSLRQHGLLCQHAASLNTLPSSESHKSLQMRRGIIRRLFRACEMAEFLSLIGCDDLEELPSTRPSSRSGPPGSTDTF